MAASADRFEVVATCTSQGTAKFGQQDRMWVGRTRAQAESAMKRLQSQVGYAWTGWRIVDKAEK